MKRLFILVLAIGFISCSSDEGSNEPVAENPTENPTMAVKFNIGGSTTNENGVFKSFINGSQTPTAESLRFDANRGDSVKIITSYGLANDQYPYYITKGLDTLQSGILKAVLRPIQPFNSIYKLVDVATNSEVVEIN